MFVVHLCCSLYLLFQKSQIDSKRTLRMLATRTTNGQYQIITKITSNSKSKVAVGKFAGLHGMTTSNIDTVLGELGQSQLNQSDWDAFKKPISDMID